VPFTRVLHRVSGTTLSPYEDAGFWDVAPCSLVEITDVSQVLTASIIRAMETVGTSETSGPFLSDYTAQDSRRVISILEDVTT
jgi:hypothetical protein